MLTLQRELDRAALHELLLGPNLVHPNVVSVSRLVSRKVISLQDSPNTRSITSDKPSELIPLPVFCVFVETLRRRCRHT